MWNSFYTQINSELSYKYLGELTAIVQYETYKTGLLTGYKKTNHFFSLVVNLQVIESVALVNIVRFIISVRPECVVLYSFLLPHLAILLLTGVFMNLSDFM